MRLMFCVTWLFLSLPPLAALATDATSYDPTQVTVKAQSVGGVPVGTIVAWPVATNPEDWDKWLECNGQSISPSAYPALWSIAGTLLTILLVLMHRAWIHAAVCLFVLYPHASIGADATSYDPTRVTVKAQLVDGIPVGSIIAVPSYATATLTTDVRWFPCDGRSTAGTALAAYMSNVPNLQGRFLQGTTATSTTIEAGLPNIIGTIFIPDVNGGKKYASGVFSGTNGTNGVAGGGWNGPGINYTFNAAK